MPIMRPSITLSTTTGGVPIFSPLEAPYEGRRMVRSWNDGFAAGLCWENKTPESRRAGFPAWSWAGWNALLDLDAAESLGLWEERGSFVEVFLEQVTNSGVLTVVPLEASISALSSSPDKTLGRSRLVHLSAIPSSYVSRRMIKGFRTSGWTIESIQQHSLCRMGT